MRTKETVVAGLLAGGLLAMPPVRGGMIGMPGPEADVTRVAEAYAAAMNRGDAAAMAAVYADDGVEMPPGKPAVRGRGAIEAYHRGELAGPVRLSGFALTASDTRVMGDAAYTTGTSRVTVNPPGDAPPVETTGKYLVVFRRQAGAWKAAYAIYNGNDPCPQR